MPDLDNDGFLYPEDTEERKTETTARAQVIAHINTNHWDFHEETGRDFGRDFVLELSENNFFKNHKIESQIKGTKNPDFIFSDQYLSYPLSVKTINYAMNASSPFVLFVVDTQNEIVYWQSIRDYSNSESDFTEKRKKNKCSISIRIPVENILTKENDSKLCELAKNGHL